MKALQKKYFSSPTTTEARRAKDLARNEEWEASIKSWEEYIAIGKFLLQQKDIEIEELLEYLEVDPESIWSSKIIAKFPKKT